MTTLPPNYLRLSSKWLETNPLPEDALAFNNGTWHGYACRGMVVPHPELYPYATARTDLPREAYADSEPGAEVASEREFETIRELRCVVSDLRAQLEAKEGELRRIKAPSVDEGSLKGLKIEYNDIDNRFYVYAADGSFLWSGDAFFNAWQCARLTAEVEELNAEVKRLTAARDEANESVNLNYETILTLREIVTETKAELDAVRKERDAEVHQTEAFIRALGYGWSGAKTIEDRQEFLKAIHQSYLRWIEWKEEAQARCGELERAVAQARNWEFLDNHKEGCQMFGLHPKPCSCGKEQRIAYLDQFLAPSQQPEKPSIALPPGHYPDSLENPVEHGEGPPEPVKAGEWLPMETAPKRKVLLRIQTSPDAFRTVEALWINGQWDFDGMLFFKPVGWKPIAPEGKATEGEG